MDPRLQTRTRRKRQRVPSDPDGSRVADPYNHRRSMQLYQGRGDEGPGRGHGTGLDEGDAFCADVDRDQYEAVVDEAAKGIFAKHVCGEVVVGWVRGRYGEDGSWVYEYAEGVYGDHFVFSSETEVYLYRR